MLIHHILQDKSEKVWCAYDLGRRFHIYLHVLQFNKAVNDSRSRLLILDILFSPVLAVTMVSLSHLLLAEGVPFVTVIAHTLLKVNPLLLLVVEDCKHMTLILFKINETHATICNFIDL